MTSISYAVTTHNEYRELADLIPFILNNMQLSDELVIIDDHSDYKTWEVFDKYIHNPNYNINFVEHGFYGHFSNHKNFMNDQCKGDWIFNIDADEKPHDALINQIKPILEINDVDLVWLPRVNTVDGITDEHIKKWGWRVTEKGWINYPDYQARVYRNAEHIKWIKPVHEVITGTKTHSHLPPYEELSLYHHKKIEKQEQQNKLYEEINANR